MKFLLNYLRTANRRCQFFLYSLYSTFYWRGAWKKALSDVCLTTRFSFQIVLNFLVKQKENLTLHQVSLGPFSVHPFRHNWRGQSQNGVSIRFVFFFYFAHKLPIIDLFLSWLHFLAFFPLVCASFLRKRMQKSQFFLAASFGDC